MKFNFKSFRLANFLSKRINTILLIVILFIILTGHVVCSCSKVPVSKVVEKFTTSIKEGVDSKITTKTTTKYTGSSTPIPTNGNSLSNKSTSDKTSMDPTGKGKAPPPKGPPKAPSKGGKSSFTNMEGFTGANTNYGQSSPYLLTSMGGNSSINPNEWNQTDLTIVNGKFGNGVADILNRPKQQIPLPEGELDMFANTQFKPECCKNNSAYSLTTGCACMTTDQYNYLATRGGNNVPYSEY